ncbi:MAG: hypothetical protein FWC94_02075 [Bacteroidales bacterium]|nr:hypothetical protein [Bacteroidales bacterium]
MAIIRDVSFFIVSVFTWLKVVSAPLNDRWTSGVEAKGRGVFIKARRAFMLVTAGVACGYAGGQHAHRP